MLSLSLSLSESQSRTTLAIRQSDADTDTDTDCDTDEVSWVVRGRGRGLVSTKRAVGCIMSVVEDESRFVRRAMEGDREAFSELAAVHWRRLLALARSIVADLEAEDVVQDAMIKAWSKLGSLKEETAFAAWMTRIVANMAIARARRRRFFEPLDGVQVAAAEAPTEVRIDVGRLLSTLPPRQRAVLHLTVIEGMTDREIGGVLAITSSTVRAHRLRAQRALEVRVKGGRST